MKTKIITILMAMIFLNLSGFASRINGENLDTLCTDNPTSAVTITVILSPDCPALQNCEFEIFAYDLSNVSVFLFQQVPIQ